MIDALLIDGTPRQSRTALLGEERVVEVLAERPVASGPRVGDVYLGRVVGVAAPLGGGFIDLGHGAVGWLRDKAIREGEALLVQVAAAAVADKGARLTRQITLVGRGVVVEPLGDGRQVSRRLGPADQRRLLALARRIPGPFGVTLRSAAAGMGDGLLEAEAALLAADAATLLDGMRSGVVPRRLRAAPPDLLQALSDHPGVRRVIGASADLVARGRRLVAGFPWAAEIAWEAAAAGPALFEVAGVESALERAQAPRVAVAGGVELGFATGPALTAIDVDSAGAAQPDPLTCNLAAARAIPGELRLRGIGGLIVVDFIGLEADRDKRAVMAELTAAAASDRRITACHGLSHLGLAELARRRTRPSLEEAMTEPCPHCAGGRHLGAMALADAVARRIARETARRPGAVVVHCSQPVAAALDDPDLGGLAALAAVAGGPVTVRVEPQARRDAFDVARANP